MKTTRDGRPMCQVRDPLGMGPVLYIDPKFYTVLRQVVERRMTCMIDLNFLDGGLGTAHIKADAEKLVKALDAAPM